MPGPGGGDVVASPTLPSENAPAVAFTKPQKLPQGSQPLPTGDAGGLQAGGVSRATADSDAKEGTEGELVESEQFIGNALAGYIRSAWSRNKRARDRIEHRLLACLRARRGVYAEFESSEMWSAGAGDQIYLPIASAKMRQAEAALRELLLPDGERPWGLEPSPIPVLPADIMQPLIEKAAELAKSQMLQIAQGQGKVIDLPAMKLLATAMEEKLKDSVLQQARKEAKERAERMESQIQERMLDGSYYLGMSEYIQEFCTYPTAVLKGPYLARKKRMKWTINSGQPEIIHDPDLTWKSVNPFDCYPAPEAETCQDGDFIERIRMSRADLFECIGTPGYNEAAIRNVLAFHSTGALRAWLWTDAERRMLEGDTHDVWIPDYLVDCLHYWGSVEGRVLIEYGIKEGIEDPLAYYEVDAVLVGTEVIRCEINDDPLGRRPYFNASYDPVPGAFWGNSIYELMRDCQSMVNACARALNANLALASGPIMVVDMGRMAAGQDPKSIKPLDVIQADSSRSQNAAAQPVYFLQADSRSQELLMIIDKFEQKADDYTGIPKYTEGSAQAMGAAGTFGGLSMLMGQAAKGFRRAVANIDRGVIGPTVEATYVYEMLYNQDTTIKGDCIIEARGAAAVLIKEHLQQTRSQFLAMALQSPMMQQIMGPQRVAALMRAVASVLEMDIDEIVPTAQQLSAEMQAQMQAPPRPTPDAQLHAQTEQARIVSKAQTEKAKAKVGLAKEALVHNTNPGIANDLVDQAFGQPQGQPQPAAPPAPRNPGPP